MLNLLLLTGLVLALGYGVGKLVHNAKLTAIVGYLVVGVILGPSVLGILSLTPQQTGVVIDVALGFVAFIIGSQLTLRLMRRLGKRIVAIILGESLGAFILVTLGVYALTRSLPEALLFGALAPASAPAGTVAIIQEFRSKGILTNALLAVVGFDDALAIIIYVIVITAVKGLLGGGFSIVGSMAGALWKIGGAIVLGAAIGAILGYLLKKARERDDLFVGVLAGILICGGLALALQVSLILTCMVLGMTLINVFPRIGQTSYRLIDQVMVPIYVVFFVVAGMELNVGLLPLMGTLGVIYIVCRIAGKMCGVFLSTTATKSRAVFRKYLGFGLFSQAGVAIGLAAKVGPELSAYVGGASLGALMITTIAATTIVFEIIGPLGAKYAITKAGELGKAAPAGKAN